MKCETVLLSEIYPALNRCARGEIGSEHPAVTQHGNVPERESPYAARWTEISLAWPDSLFGTQSMP